MTIPFARMLAPLRRSINNLALRATVRLVNATSKMQTLQISMREGETKDGIEHVEPYGFTSHPNAGAEAVTLFFNGDRSHGIAVVVGDRRYRLTGLEEGEVALHDDQGQKVYLKRDRILVETPFTFEVVADKINLHAASEFRFDVNGQGEIWDGEGVTTYRDDDVAKPHYDHAPPRIP
jgi:phage baseplate assembly protein V